MAREYSAVTKPLREITKVKLEKAESKGNVRRMTMPLLRTAEDLESLNGPIVNGEVQSVKLKKVIAHFAVVFRI